MAKFLLISVFTLGMATAAPQYGQPSSSSFAAAPAPSFAPAAPAPSFSNAAPVASSSSSSSASSGPLSVNCQVAPGSGGNLKYDCSGVDKNAITLKTEHFLWLENQGGQSQNLDIEIPNYNIDEFIKAAYKALGPEEGAKINILLKKPDITYNAAKQDPTPQQVGQPSVSVNYQPVDKVSVHYPSQKAYTSGGPAAVDPLAGAPAASVPAPAPVPAAPSAPAAPAAPAASGAYSRPQRESGYRYYVVRQKV